MEERRAAELGERRSPVWEEALLEELLYSIGHLNHCEQHLLEIDSQVQLPVFLDLVNRLREERKILGQVLFAVERAGSGEAGGDLRTAWESVWCTLKHLTTALIHVDECIEKVARLSEGRDSAELSPEVASLLGVRRRLLESAVELLRRAKANASLLTESSARCREDLCLEAEGAGGK
jgi:Zn-dependent oligopeptidase